MPRLLDPDVRQTRQVVVSTSPRMVLSPEVMLIYVLHRGGLVGRVSSGRVARDESGALIVYDRYGRIVEYLSAPAENVRSWCVLGPSETPVDGWHDIKHEDRSKILRV